jgi:hypothetical protein
MVGVFRECEWKLLVKFLERGASFNSEWYVRTFKNVTRRIRMVRTNRKMNQFLLLAWQRQATHQSVHKEGISNNGWWTALTHPPHNPDLVNSDLHLLDRLNDELRGSHLRETTTWNMAPDLQQRLKAIGLEVFTRKWKRCLIMKKTLWKIIWTLHRT